MTGTTNELVTLRVLLPICHIRELQRVTARRRRGKWGVTLTSCVRLIHRLDEDLRGGSRIWLGGQPIELDYSIPSASGGCGYLKCVIDDQTRTKLDQIKLRIDITRDSRAIAWIIARALPLLEAIDAGAKMTAQQSDGTSFELVFYY